MNKVVAPKRARKIILFAFIFLAVGGLSVAISWWRADSLTIRKLPDFSSIQNVKMKT